VPGSSYDVLADDGAVDIMARGIHEQYLQHNEDSAPADHPAKKPWEDLDDAHKSQNRNQARDNIVKLRENGYDVVPAAVANPDVAVDSLPEELVDELASKEHDRWARQKRAQGYEYGERYIDKGDDLRHPDLKAWSDLEDHVRDKDRAPVRNIPLICSLAGFAIERRSAS
jgi:hypothetical protein